MNESYLATNLPKLIAFAITASITPRIVITEDHRGYSRLACFFTKDEMKSLNYDKSFRIYSKKSWVSSTAEN